jgi:Flp pilus assembly pilin Flp
MVALIAVVAGVTATTLGTAIAAKFTAVGTSI